MAKNYFEVVTSGSKDLIQAFLFSDDSITCLSEILEVVIPRHKYKVLVREPLKWVSGDSLDPFKELPWATRRAELPVRKLFIATQTDPEMQDYTDMNIVLGKLGLVQAVLKLDNYEIEQGLLIVSF